MQILDTNSFKTKVFDFGKSKTWNFIGQRPAIIDFYADWCGPCRMLAPVLEELSRDYAGKVDIYKVNTERDPHLAALFGVKGIPALLFAPIQGKPVMTSGFAPKPNLERAIKEIFGVSKNA